MHIIPEVQPQGANSETTVVRVREKGRLNAANNERGMALYVMAVLMVPVGLVLALFMDAGRLYVVRGQMQVAADAAALAAASGLIQGQDADSIQARAAYYAAANLVETASPHLDSLTMNTDAGTLRVVLSHQTGALFLAPGGITVRMAAEAKADLVDQENEIGRPIPNGNAYGWWKHEKDKSEMAGKDSGLVKLGS
jgi:Putative Flp pilus-assembly TadE/G-like